MSRAGCASLFNWRRSKKIGGVRVTATHRGLSTSARLPGTGISVSSKRGVTLFGRKLGKKKRRR